MEAENKLINFETLTYIRKVVEETFTPLTQVTTQNLQYVGELKTVYEELMTELKMRFSNIEN